MIDNQGFMEGMKYLDTLFDLKLESQGLRIVSSVGPRNAFCKSVDTLEIKYTDKCSFYRMLVMGIKSGLSHHEEKESTCGHLTYMLDCSRNAVINAASAKRLIGHLCVLGYHELSLYTEDTYEVVDEPCFGYLRGRFTEEEIREIVSFAEQFGMSVTLSIECLAHMRSIYRYETYYKNAFDCNDVLLVGSERVELLLEHIFSTIATLLPTKTVNIGMDEPFMLGRGKSLNLHGYVEPGELFLQHLKTIVRIAEKYEIRLKMWGDCVNSHYNNSEEILAFAKKHGIKMIFWHYGGASQGEMTVEQVSQQMAETCLNKEMALYPDCALCISDQKYYGVAPHNNLGLHISKGYVDAAIRCGIEELWLSSWGDCGAEVSPFATLPIMAYVGYAYVYHKEMISFEEFFKQLFGSLEAFLMLDYANCLNEKLDMKLNTSSKYFLYQDVFMGIMDKSIKREMAENYSLHIAELKSAKQRVAKQYEYLFDTQISLLEVLLLKHDLGHQTREAFSQGCKKELCALIPIYQSVIEKIKVYFSAFRTQWYRDNKVFGFEIQEARIGALIFRMENCLERMDKYCKDEIDDIPELQEDILDLFGSESSIIMLNWGELISPGNMIEYFSFV